MSTDYWRERAIRAEKKLKQLELLPRVDSLPPIRTTGENYVHSCGQCSALPWEECACSFTKEETINMKLLLAEQA